MRWLGCLPITVSPVILLHWRHFHWASLLSVIPDQFTLRLGYCPREQSGFLGLYQFGPFLTNNLSREETRARKGPMRCSTREKICETEEKGYREINFSQCLTERRCPFQWRPGGCRAYFKCWCFRDHLEACGSRRTVWERYEYLSKIILIVNRTKMGFSHQ